jgi:hypothetical protein
MDLDSGVLVDLAVRVATEVVPSFEDLDLEPELAGGLFGDGEPEEPRADDDQVCHEISASGAMQRQAGLDAAQPW